MNKLISNLIVFDSAGSLKCLIKAHSKFQIMENLLQPETLGTSRLIDDGVIEPFIYANILFMYLFIQQLCLNMPRYCARYRRHPD